MAITREQFENRVSFQDEQAVAESIVRYLYANAQYAFTHREVGGSIGRHEGFVREMLGKLAGLGYIEQCGEYWASRRDPAVREAVEAALKEFEGRDGSMGEESFIEVIASFEE